MTEYEIRSAGTWDMPEELRTATDGDGLTLTGYAVPFGRLSGPIRHPLLNRGRPFREVLHDGALAKSLAEAPDITLRYQHEQTALPLARTKGGTMTLTPDAHGVRVWARLPDNEWGRPVRDAVARGDIDGMSIRYMAVRDNARNGEFPQEDTGTGMEAVRHLHEIKLYREISLTEMPAFPGTSAAVRSLADAAGIDPEALADAFRTLNTPDAPVDEAHTRLVMDALYARLGKRPEPSSIADARARLERLSAR